MTTIVNICNLALAHLGDTATVASIHPPEGSAQAEHCARFYPLALSTLLSMHPWGFATRYSPLAQIEGDWIGWQYGFMLPAKLLRILEVTDYQGHPIEHERHGEVIMTNHSESACEYIFMADDPSTYPPKFIEALSWQLASMLAGPLIKGDVGAAQSKVCLQVALATIREAKFDDANEGRRKTRHIVPWMAGR